MPKSLQTADKILFILNFFGDFLAEEKNPLGLFSSSYRSVFSFTANKRRKNNFQQALSRSLRQGLVEKKKAGRDVFIRLTGSGRRKLYRRYPNLAYRPQRGWDGYFRLAAFDVAEPYRKIRTLIRQILLDHGFRPLQQSLYLTPFKVETELKKYLENIEIGSFVRVFLSNSLGDPKEVARSVWPLEEVNDAYRRILQDYEVNRHRPLLRERFLEVAAADPYLPDTLLPDDWLGPYVEKKVLEKDVLVQSGAG